MYIPIIFTVQNIIRLQLVTKCFSSSATRVSFEVAHFEIINNIISIIRFLIYFRFKLSAQDLTSALETPEENLCPSSHVPLSAYPSSIEPLCPIPLEELVQKGTTVLFVKSLSFTKLLIGQAAIPHQIG